MRHAVRTKKLGRTAAHRQALLRNLARSLFIYERVKTTLAKAKQAQRFAERLLSAAQHPSLAARRQAVSVLGDKTVVKKLFDEIGPRFKDRVGGCTRIYRLGPRASDGAEMAFLDLLVRKERPEKEKGEKKKGK